jgi:hypothetical protein
VPVKEKEEEVLLLFIIIDFPYKEKPRQPNSSYDISLDETLGTPLWR